jgi:hypothetical protein
MSAGLLSTPMNSPTVFDFAHSPKLTKEVFAMKSTLAILFSLLAAGVSGEESKLFSSNSDWNKGFESLRIGMSVSELVESRPDAKVSEFDKADMREDDPRRVDLDRSESILDFPTKGINLLVRYEVADQRLKRILFIWAGPSDATTRVRASFIQFCIDNFGSGFQPEIMEQNANRPEKLIAPLMCWEIAQISVSASCTPDSENLELEHGAFTLVVEPNDEESISNRAKKKSAQKGFDHETRRRVFKDAGIDISVTGDSAGSTQNGQAAK